MYRGVYMNIQVMSRAELKDFDDKINQPTIIISITEKNGEDLILKNPNIRSILHLKFDDEVEGDNIITDAQADQIKNFIQSNPCDNLIVQCFAGVSRSAGVAAAISLAVNGNDMPIFSNPRFVPNMLCYRKVLNAFMGSIVEMEQEIGDKEAINLDVWKKAQDL